MAALVGDTGGMQVEFNMQEFLALLRLHGVPVTPAHGMPSGPRTVNEPVEKRSVVGRGLRHPQATYAAALQQASQRPQRCARNAAACAGGGCSCRQPAQRRDADMADAAQPAAASAATAGQPETEQRPSAGQMEAAVCSLLEAVVPQHMRQVGPLSIELPAAGHRTVSLLIDMSVSLHFPVKLTSSRSRSVLWQGLEDGAQAYVQQMLASTAGYRVSLADIAADPDCSSVAPQVVCIPCCPASAVLLRLGSVVICIHVAAIAAILTPDADVCHRCA